MLLQLSTWLEVESYLEQSQGIIIPIGSTEQHGPASAVGFPQRGRPRGLRGGLPRRAAREGSCDIERRRIAGNRNSLNSTDRKSDNLS